MGFYAVKITMSSKQVLHCSGIRCFKVYHELQTDTTLFWDFVLKSLPRFTNRSYTVLGFCAEKSTKIYKQVLHCSRILCCKVYQELHCSGILCCKVYQELKETLHCSGIMCCKVYHEFQTGPTLFWDFVL